ncbi:hypothetical protein AX16_006267 [Volvariella volvacea WC 439]|nr:hypothetical protein AX16_006267 [Volvariella volvacea WC 439]
MMIVEALNEAEEGKKRGGAGKEAEREQEQERERGQEMGGGSTGSEVMMNDTSAVDASMMVLSPSQANVDSATVVLGQRGDAGVGLGLETPGASTSAATASATAPSASTMTQTQAQTQATNEAGSEDIDELKGLDEEELDWFLLSSEEVKTKERVWVELNRDYLEANAAKNLQAEKWMSNSRSRKKRKTTIKSRDATTPHGTTAAESVRDLLKKIPKYSKRINYDALKDLFADQLDKELMSRFGGDTTMLSMDDDDDIAGGGGGGKMDRMSVASGFGPDKGSRGRRGEIDEDEDDEERRPIIVMEDENHPVPARQSVSQTSVVAGSVGSGVVSKGIVGADEDAEGNVDEEEGDELVVGGWEDAYEQEV